MPVSPISSQDDVGDALALLTEGFPNKFPSIWPVYFDRLRRMGGNDQTNTPLGYVMRANGRPSGVIVTPASLRERADGHRGLVINMSSWYVEPADRWRAGRMLQSILGRHDAMFTDLTPTPEVTAMLPGLGFQPINDGVVVTALPFMAALPARGANMVPLSQYKDALPHLERANFEAHEAEGCLAAVLVDGDRATRLLFRTCVLRKVPAAFLIYCSDLVHLQTGLSAVARFLVRKRVAFLISDDTGHSLRTGQIRRPRGKKFVRPGAGLAHLPHMTDHMGSELALLDIY